MKILIFGLPGSGKSYLADRLNFLMTDQVEWINADVVREQANDWDFTEAGRLRQKNRMWDLCKKAENEGKIALADFVCPYETARQDFGADYTIWVNTIEAGRFEDTNAVFEPPVSCDYEVTEHRGDEDAKIIRDIINDMLVIPATWRNIDELDITHADHQPWINFPWGDLTVFDTDRKDISLHRVGEPHGMFPNTKFLLQHSNIELVDTLTIVVGESWCYGGKIRDMNKGGGESRDSFVKALTKTMGANIARLGGTDLLQSAFPGDNTSNMVQKAISAVEQYRHTYKHIRVLVQFTDVIRESGVLSSLPDDDHMKKFYGDGIAPNVESTPMPFLDFLNSYETGYLDKLSKQCDYDNVDICVWKNFTPWSINQEQQAQYKNIKFIPGCWVNYLSDMEGYDVNIRYFNNPAMVSSEFQSMIDTPQSIVEQELDRIERMHDYWDSVSGERAGLNVHYPSMEGHRLWALKIVKEAGWFK